MVGKIKNSIVTKWMIGIFSIVVVIVLVAVVTICSILNTYFENSIKEELSEYVNVFKGLSTASKKEFYKSAVSLAENFENKDKVKVEIYDADGKMIASTDGFLDDIKGNELSEYREALTSKDNTATFKGKAGGNESILATAVIVKNSNGISTGFYRYIISMRPLEKTVLTYNLLIGAVGVLMVLITVISGIFFITSIVRPVRQVTGAARKIAMGDLDTRLDVKDSGEIGELCETINFMATELGKTEALKNDFISSVSHELRTPLTAIRGWGETVDMSIGNDDELVKRGVDVILSETDRLSKLVEELLDFSRMQTGNLTVETERVNIGDVLGSTVGMYEELAKKQGIVLTYFPPKEDTFVRADKNRIKQVFVNIIDNAVKYTDDGGDIIISSVEKPKEIKIIISDTGVGIPEEDIEHVKEKFYKANKTVRGSGIGLAVADEIVKQHGGSIIIESKETVGTNVTVTIPREILGEENEK